MAGTPIRTARWMTDHARQINAAFEEVYTRCPAPYMPHIPEHERRKNLGPTAPYWAAAVRSMEEAAEAVADLANAIRERANLEPIDFLADAWERQDQPQG